MALFNQQRMRAEHAGRGAVGHCPWTGKEVKAHVGQLRQYWAYAGGQPKFTNGYEPETEWHLSWKQAIRDDCCEVVMGTNNEHRADILGANNTVIEIQRSKIDIRDSRERAEFYKEQTGRRVVWVVNIEDFWRKTFSLSDEKVNGYMKADWKPVRTWLLDLAKRPDSHVYLEFNEQHNCLLHAWVHKGELLVKWKTKQDFFKQYMDEVAKPEYQGYTDKAKDCLTKPKGIHSRELSI